MGKGSGQQTAEQILYGEHPRVYLLSQEMAKAQALWRQLTPEDLTSKLVGSHIAWFEDYHGWSGTDFFMVKKERLPSDYLWGLSDKEIPAEKVNGWRETEILSLFNSNQCRFSNCELEPNADPQMLQAGQDFIVPIAAIAAVELALEDKTGQWQLSGFDDCIVYVVAGEAKGVVWGFNFK